MEKIPMLCFPHAGAGKLYYSKWRTEFTDAIDWNVVQYPLREQRMRTPMPPTVAELAENIFAEFADIFRRTYVIWGHSMGSVIGYEVARLCQDRLDNPPLVFFSSGASAPSRARFAHVADLDTSEGFRDVLHRYGGVSKEHLRDPDFMTYFAPIIEADLRLLGGYQDMTFDKLRCPVALMMGRSDTATTDMWQRYTDHPLEVTEFDGGHFFLDEHRSAMASLMESQVESLSPGSKGTAERVRETAVLREIR
ncbi:thioesterase II family protein [Streptomyces sp. NPDC017520]|uniref:thioesterase II family protein n=1 Tax=Streptomyces sp. NPDC017520 TaxID=3364998 RepID=UPI00378A1C6F